jgi:hypothetical protein
VGKLSITFFLLLCVRAVIAQSTIGLPAIRNYKNTDYQGANAVWDIVQDARGILYFGNDDGLLTYDGHYWKRYTLPNKAAIKSVAIDRKGRIFVGGQDELGYFLPDTQGALRFFSLKTLLPDVARQFADIWDIVVTGDTVVFRTNECIFRYDGTHMRTYDAPAGWRLLESAGSRLFADDKEQGLREWRGGAWAPACSNAPADLRVTGVTGYRGDTLLVSTLRRGLFLLNGSVLTSWPAQLPAGSQIGSAHRIAADRYALGTRTGGVYIVDGKGALIQQFSTSEGLQSNHVLSVLEDRDHHLWLGLESGVSFIDYPTALTHIYPSGDHQVLSNAVAILDGVMYIGTSNGLYSASLDGGGKDFSLVPGTQGQVWTLEVIDGTLFMGHQDGVFVIRNGQAQPIATAQGAWGVVKGPGNTLVSGTYTGLRFVQNEQGRFVDGGRVTDYYESLSVLAADDQGNVWAAHPHRGLYRTPVPGDSTYYYNHLDGLPSDLDNYPYKIRGRVVFATAKGIYAFDGRRFHPDTAFARLFGDTSVEFLTEELSTGDIWFISRQQVGMTDGKRTVYFPELNGQTVRGAGYIYPYDRDNIFVGTNNGIIRLDYGRYVQADTAVQVLLSAVYAVAARDSLVFGGYPVAEKTPHFPNRWNSFHFEYASPLYAQDNSVVYSYYLEGFDKTWSEWSSKPEKEYTNLPYGAYTFLVKARNNLGNTSAPAAYPFVVEPAWYQTWWAYAVYLLLASVLVGLIVRRQRRRFELHQRRHEAEQERLRYLHRLELDSKEKSKLEAELATVTMHLVERGGLLSNIKEEMISVIKRLNIPQLPYEFRSVFKLMTDTGKEEDDWNRFSLYFDQVHNNFLTTLKTRFPLLSPTDLKMCAYLRLNLSSKEIAQLLNISPKGVEISRYRIRKKLGLTPEVNLFDFLTDMGA